MENVKVIAWEFLLKLGFENLPVNAMTINGKTEDIRIASYAEAQDYITNMEYEQYTQKYNGFAAYEKNIVRIFYDDALTSAERNFTICHELGHYALGHTSSNHILGKSKNEAVQNEQEEEADAFAYAFLSPAPILLAININAPAEISRLTGLSAQRADKAVLHVIKEKNIQHTAIEGMLIERFHTFIECNQKYALACQQNSYNSISCIKEPALRTKNIKKLLLSFIICILLCTFLTLALHLKNNTAWLNSIQTAASIPLQEPIQKPVIASFDKTTVSMPEKAQTPLADETIPGDTTTDNSTAVYISTHGQAYHLADCQYIKNKTNVISLTIEEVQTMGLRKCKVCWKDSSN